MTVNDCSMRCVSRWWIYLWCCYTYFIYFFFRSVKNKVDKIIEKDGNLIPKSVMEAMKNARSLEEVNELVWKLPLTLLKSWGIINIEKIIWIPLLCYNLLYCLLCTYSMRHLKKEEREHWLKEQEALALIHLHNVYLIIHVKLLV